jgi:hypothetical protein
MKPWQDVLCLGTWTPNCLFWPSVKAVRVSWGEEGSLLRLPQGLEQLWLGVPSPPSGLIAFRT